MLFLQWAKVSPSLFAGFALAGLQNVTVDDAVLTGAVVPQYLPSLSNWNIGNDCPVCALHPDPSQAYNGTWHDTTYIQSNGFTQGIEFTFTGNGLYIFFILANNFPGISTFTALEFMLDQTLVDTYIHPASSSPDFQYNVPVYANDSLVSGEHTMLIQPVVNTGNHVLILFDYLIYTVDTMDSPSSVPPSTSSMIVASIGATSSPTVSSTTAPSPSSTTTSTLSPSPSSSSSPLPASANTVMPLRPDTSDIVGGSMGGVAVLVIVAASLLCYRRRKVHNNDLPSVEEGAVVDPFVLSHEVNLGRVKGTALLRPSVSEPTSRSRTFSTQQPSDPQASTAELRSSDSALVEEVELLRNEVARLRYLQHSSTESPPEAPPIYS